MKIKIAPSILTADFGNLLRDIKAAEEAGADWLHMDIMDGQFVPNITFGSLVLKSLKDATSLPIDTHLMIAEPDRFIEDFIASGSKYITVHAEACPHLHRTLQHIRDKGGRAGVALNPATPLQLVDYVLSDIDLLLIMTVNPGFGGQKFIPGVVPKIAAARKLIDKLDLQIELEVDGGINPENAACVASAGASVIVAGAAVFNKKASVKENISALRRAITSCGYDKR